MNHGHEHDTDLLDRIREGERRRRQLSPQEELIHKRHAEYHEKHKGHEQVHFEEPKKTGSGFSRTCSLPCHAVTTFVVSVLQMHMEMFLILIVTLLIAQVILVEWKKR